MMRSMKQLRGRMNSIRQTRQMTATLKVVSLARLKKKHAQLLEATPYLTEMDRMVRRLIYSINLRQEETDVRLLPSLLSTRSKDQKYVVVVVTSDSGLNGNASLGVLQKTGDLIHYLSEQKKEVQIVSFGTHGASFFKHNFPNLPLHTLACKSLDKEQGYLSATRLAMDLINAFNESRLDACLCVYNHFENMVIQHPTIRQLIPNHLFEHKNPWEFLIKQEEIYKRKNVLGQTQVAFQKAGLYKVLGTQKLSNSWGQLNEEVLHATTRRPEAYDYEPADVSLLNEILPRYLTAYMHAILLESSVCDEAARLMAMDNATHNADEILFDLAREFRHLRQDKITNGTIQLMSGVMAGG